MYCMQTWNFKLRVQMLPSEVYIYICIYTVGLGSHNCCISNQTVIWSKSYAYVQFKHLYKMHSRYLILEMTFETMEKLHASQHHRTPWPELHWGNGHLLDSCRPSLWISEGAIQKSTVFVVCFCCSQQRLWSWGGDRAVTLSWECNLEPNIFSHLHLDQSHSYWAFACGKKAGKSIIFLMVLQSASPEIFNTSTVTCWSSREAVISLVSAIFGSCVLSSQRWY